jgi:hypothetical protein
MLLRDYLIHQPAFETVQIGEGDFPKSAPLSNLCTKAFDGPTFPVEIIPCLDWGPDLNRPGIAGDFNL